MSKHASVNPVIWFPSKRVLRTAFTTILTILPLIPQIIAVIQGQWDADWLTAVGVQAVAINAALTGIIAIPAVNAFLTRFGLGSAPNDPAKLLAESDKRESPIIR